MLSRNHYLKKDKKTRDVKRTHIVIYEKTTIY